MQWVFDLLGTLKDFLVAVSAGVTVVSFFAGWALLLLALGFSVRWVLSF